MVVTLCAPITFHRSVFVRNACGNARPIALCGMLQNENSTINTEPKQSLVFVVSYGFMMQLQHISSYIVLAPLPTA